MLTGLQLINQTALIKDMYIWIHFQLQVMKMKKQSLTLESIHGDDQDDEQWRAEWMQETGRHPNQPVEMDFKNLGAQDLDLQYDWIENSPHQNLVTTV